MIMEAIAELPPEEQSSALVEYELGLRAATGRSRVAVVASQEEESGAWFSEASAGAERFLQAAGGMDFLTAEADRIMSFADTNADYKEDEGVPELAPHPGHHGCVG